MKVHRLGTRKVVLAAAVAERIQVWISCRNRRPCLPRWRDSTRWQELPHIPTRALVLASPVNHSCPSSSALLLPSSQGRAMPVGVISIWEVIRFDLGKGRIVAVPWIKSPSLASRHHPWMLKLSQSCCP